MVWEHREGVQGSHIPIIYNLHEWSLSLGSLRRKSHVFPDFISLIGGTGKGRFDGMILKTQKVPKLL